MLECCGVAAAERVRKVLRPTDCVLVMLGSSIWHCNCCGSKLPKAGFKPLKMAAAELLCKPGCYMFIQQSPTKRGLEANEPQIKTSKQDFSPQEVTILNLSPGINHCFQQYFTTFHHLSPCFHHVSHHVSPWFTADLSALLPATVASGRSPAGAAKIFLDPSSSMGFVRR